MTTSNNPRERRSHILLVFESTASSTETRLWTWLVLGVQLLKDMILIEAEGQGGIGHTEYFKKIGFSGLFTLGG